MAKLRSGLTIEALLRVINKSVSKKGAYNQYFITARPEPPARDAKKWLEMYNQNPRMSPITKLSLDIATTKGKVVRVNKDGSEDVLDNHPILDFLYKPNTEYDITGTASLYLSQVYFLVKGESFGVIERDAGDRPKSMWFVPPSWVTTPADNDTGMYEVKLKNGQVMHVDPRDMFYRKNPNPLDPMGRGVGRVESLGDEIETDEYMSKFAKRFFFNDATPNIVITAPEDADDEEIRKAELRWYQKFAGYLNSNKAAFLNWKADLHILNTSNREMDFIESRKFYRDLSIQHFGIPPEIMGNVENSNKATVVAARDIYRNEVLNPMFIEFEEAITWQILKQYSGSENLKFVFIREQEDRSDFVIEMAQKAYDQGNLTFGEYRKILSSMLKYDLHSLGDMDKYISVPSSRVIIDPTTGKVVITGDNEPENKETKD